MLYLTTILKYVYIRDQTVFRPFR